MKISADKKLHFFASALLVALFFILSENLLVSVCVTFIIGVAKEVWYDNMLKRGTPDGWDIVSNIAGMSFASLVIGVSTWA